LIVTGGWDSIPAPFLVKREVLETHQYLKSNNFNLENEKCPATFTTLHPDSDRVGVFGR
jgi:hypothetical protein